MCVFCIPSRELGYVAFLRLVITPISRYYIRGFFFDRELSRRFFFRIIISRRGLREIPSFSRFTRILREIRNFTLEIFRREDSFAILFWFAKHIFFTCVLQD